MWMDRYSEWCTHAVAKSNSHRLTCEQPLSNYPSGIPHVHQRRLDDWMSSINSNDARSMWNDLTPDLWQGLIITQRADSLNHSHHALDFLRQFLRVKELLYIIALWNIFSEYFKSIILSTDLPKDFTFVVFLFLFSKTIETRIHSCRMHTARSSSRPGGLHQAPPREEAPPQRKHPLGGSTPWEEAPPLNRILDTRLWKYYLAPNFVSGQ